MDRSLEQLYQRAQCLPQPEYSEAMIVLAGAQRNLNEYPDCKREVLDVARSEIRQLEDEVRRRKNGKSY